MLTRIKIVALTTILTMLLISVSSCDFIKPYTGSKKRQRLLEKKLDSARKEYAKHTSQLDSLGKELERLEREDSIAWKEYFSDSISNDS